MKSGKSIDLITKAKTHLLLRHPFYSILALRTEFKPYTEAMNKSGLPKTMATDGKNIYYSEEWTESLTREECMGVIAHEVLHIALLHSLRLRGRQPMLWNVACDYAINNTLVADGFKLPKDGCVDPKYANQHAEQIYADLQKNQRTVTINMGGGKGDKSEQGDEKGPSWGNLIPPTDDQGNALSDAERSELEAEVKIMVTAAIEAQKSIGKVPGCVQELIDQYSKPKVQWRDFLPTWLTGSQPDDYSWRRPSRKWIHREIYMPSIKRIGCGKGALMIDTSGSVSTQELRRFLSEIIGIVEDCKPEELVIVPCDTHVKGAREWVAGDDLQDIEAYGRGGTYVTPAFKWVAENRPDVEWGVYFTDLQVNDFPDEPPPYPVIWLTTQAKEAPWGTVLPVDIE